MSAWTISLQIPESEVIHDVLFVTGSRNFRTKPGSHFHGRTAASHPKLFTCFVTDCHGRDQTARRSMLTEAYEKLSPLFELCIHRISLK
jgi:hypothetical protein